MTIYEAIMAAADKIESDPRSYNFHQSEVPRDLTQDGCLQGWIGHFLGHGGEMLWATSARTRQALGSEPICPVLNDMGYFDWVRAGNDRYTTIIFNAATAAAFLRYFARRFEPRTFTGLPDSIRQIFDVETV